nr:VWA domain-containing protein [Rhizobium sp. SSA_523]
MRLKEAKVPVTLREYLDLLAGMEAGLADFDIEAFYFLARAALVKDERHIDRFDQVFAAQFRGLSALADSAGMDVGHVPEAWLRKLAEKHLTPEEKALVESLGGFEKLMETLKKRLEEQQGRHQGGSKWIGTAGTSPFGGYGYNPEGVRIGQDSSRHRKAVKVWDSRDFRDFDDSREIGTRNIKVALKRLRRWVRQGAADELDLDGTIRSTAEHGYLSVQTRPERRNSVKLLMFFDVGGSMDDHVMIVEELFSAARAEFRHLEHFYFHNCLYESVWRDNRRRAERLLVADLLRSYGPDYRVIFVGDATMSPYEITHSGGSVEHWNKEPGALWMQRVTGHFRRVAWINPVAPSQWDFTQSVILLRHLLEQRMFPLTLQGLDQAMQTLAR